jgi:trimethylamine--corrinoid protein Co-methyltransferase
MLGQCQRCVRGIEVTEDSVSLEVIRQVCLEGPGHFLGSDQTLGLMQTEYVYPLLGDRTSPKEWAEKGRPDLIQKTIARKREILDGFFPGHLPYEVDKAVRQKFRIHLPPEAVGIGR